MNGMLSDAPNDSPSRLNTPTWIAGRPTLTDAVIPLASTSIDGPPPALSGSSAVPAFGRALVCRDGASPPLPSPTDCRNSWSFETNSRTPTNCMSVTAGSTSGFSPDFE
jgi:hypothetical protein